MYKLVAIDLDGKLLNSYGEISKENKEALCKALEKGVEIVLTSGRVISSIKNFSKEIGDMNYLISGNGSAVFDIKNNNIIYNQNLEKEKILKIIKICEENSFYYSIYTEREIITKSLQYNNLFYQNENSNKLPEDKININITQNIYKYVEESKEDKFLKISICDEDKTVFNNIMRKLKQIKNIDVLDVAHLSRKLIKSGTEIIPIEYFYTEITNKNVNKWGAIEFLIQKLGIKREEVVAIGDNVNDIEMIKNAGLGIIMGNSAPYIKEIADVVVSDNNSNGVKEAIEKYIL